MTTTSILQPMMTHSTVSPREWTAIIQLRAGCGDIIRSQERWIEAGNKTELNVHLIIIINIILV